MKQHFQDIFVTPDTHQPLHYKGTFTNGFWSDGILQIPSGDTQYPLVFTLKNIKKLFSDRLLPVKVTLPTLLPNMALIYTFIFLP